MGDGFLLYIIGSIFDFVIANYRRIKIVKIKHYGKGKKDSFNFYGKSRENTAAITSASSNDYRQIEEKSRRRRRMPKALIVPCEHLESLYLDSTRR